MFLYILYLFLLEQNKICLKMIFNLLLTLRILKVTIKIISFY